MSASPHGAGHLEPVIRDRRSSWSDAISGIAASAWTVFRFELNRSYTWRRELIWAVVASFPAGILLLMRRSGAPLPEGVWLLFIFIMAVEMVTILNALLWIAPIVQTELEGKTWLYLAARPYGRFALVIGKGLNGLAWTMSAGLFAVSLSYIAASLGAQEADRYPGADILVMTGIGAPLKSIGAMLGLTAMGAMAYSTMFAAIGCIVPRRAMLICFSYTLIFEVLVSLIPAVINRLTVQYHLRCLLTSWIDLGIKEWGGWQFLFSEWWAGWHVICLLAMPLFWMSIALGVVHYRQYVTNDEA